MSRLSHEAHAGTDAGLHGRVPGQAQEGAGAVKHFFLRYVFDDKLELVESCGFVPFKNDLGQTLWQSPIVFSGPLEGRWLCALGVITGVDEPRGYVVERPPAAAKR